MSAIKIQSQNVILVEGDADEFVPQTKAATGMHGFTVMVPPGEEGERPLDMLWRITMAYAGMPRLLASRTTVRKMVEAVMGKESREPNLDVAQKADEQPVLDREIEMRALVISGIHANLTPARINLNCLFAPEIDIF